MTPYAKDPATYTHEVLDDSIYTRPVTPTIVRDKGEITISFTTPPEYVYQETGQAPGGYPNRTDGGGNVELRQQAPAEIVNLDLPWLTAIRVTGYFLDYGEYDHPHYTSSNGFQFSCIAQDMPAGFGYGVAPDDSGVAEPPEAPTGWTPNRTLPVDLEPPFWLGTIGAGGFFDAGIWYGAHPPGLIQNPDLSLSSGIMMSDVGADGRIERARCRVSYTMGGFQTGPYDPADFGYHPLYVQPGSAHITIDAFLFEGGMEWDWGDTEVTTAASWGIIAA